MKSIAIILGLSALALVGCANPMTGTSSGYERAQQAQSAEYATVVAVRDVVVANQNDSQVGQVIGAAIGGLAGHAVGKKMSGDYTIKALAGTIGGALGVEAGRRSTQGVKGQEIVLETQSGNLLTVAQSSADGVKFAKGQRVMLVGGERVAPVN